MQKTINDIRISEMKRRLSALNPRILEITDESHQHIGHAGAATGLGHFRLKISGGDIENKGSLQAHRLIYSVLGEMMQTDIHALSIEIIKPSN